MADYDTGAAGRGRFSAPFNNRGLIFICATASCSAPLRSIQYPRCRSTPATDISTCLILSRVQTLRKTIQFGVYLFHQGQAAESTLADSRLPLHHLYRDPAAWTRACAWNEVLAQHPKFAAHWRRSNVYRVKGDLDAALGGSTTRCKLVRTSSMAMSAAAIRGAQGSRRRPRRLPLGRWARVDDWETTLARRFARERLAALVAADPSLRSQSARRWRRHRQADLVIVAGGCGDTQGRAIVGNRGYRSVPALANPRATQN